MLGHHRHEEWNRRENVQRITGTYKGETWKTIKIDFNQLKRNSADSIEIAKEAFRNCYELENLVIENWDDSISLAIDDEAFLNSPDHLTVYCPKDTKLQKRLQKLGIRWKEYHKKDWENVKGSSYVFMNTLHETCD